MDKDLIIKIAAVAVVLFFIFEMFALGVLGNNRSTTTNQNAVTSNEVAGSAEFDIKINSYEPYLVAKNLSSEQTTSLKKLDGVEDVLLTDRGYVLSLKSSKYVRLVYQQLLLENVSASAVANAAFPNTITIQLGNGSEETAVSGGILFKFSMFPFVEEGQSVRVSASVKAKDGILESSTTPALAPIETIINVTGFVTEKIYDVYSFTIPWEKRNEINTNDLIKVYGADNVSYSKKNDLLLLTPLTPADMVSKKYDYLSYIGETIITPLDNFTDKARIQADFGNLTYPNSVLAVRSSVSVALPYPSNKSQVYSVDISNPEYGLSEIGVPLAFDNATVGKNMSLHMQVLLIGKTITNVLDIYAD